VKRVPYISFAAGLAWLIAAIYVWNTGFILGLHFNSRVNPLLANALFDMFFCVVFLGWIVPIAIGTVRLLRR
jgi:hypothetical protein